MGGKMMKWLAPIAALLAFAGAGGAWAGEGALAVTTEPRDAEIFIDGKLMASKTPAILRLPEGSHVVEARKPEHYTKSLTVTIPSDGVVSLKVPALAPWAELRLTVEPADAEVSVDGKPVVGNASRTIRLPEGQHKVEVRRNEHLEKTAAVTIPKEGGTSQKVILPTAPKMVAIPPGSFLMGSNSEESYSRPAHRVTINYAFELSATPVTFDQWDACLADGGCDGYKPYDQGWGRGDRPAINVSWDDAQKYLQWLNRRTGKRYRLPTEAEWEYAARGGTTTKYWWGDEVGKNNANCDGCGGRWDGMQTAPVGSFKPNPFGLYDMLGNVWQWTEDCWHDSYDGAPTDGRAWTEACKSHSRVHRGGSWYGSPDFLRSASRYGRNPDGRILNIGFRVARTLP